jgi:hypothetical protein
MLFSVDKLETKAVKETVMLGFLIMFRIDMRDVFNSRGIIKMELWGSNQILITMPAWPFCLIDNDDCQSEEAFVGW